MSDHAGIYLLFLKVLISTFKKVVTQPHSRCFFIEVPTPGPRNIKWHCISQVLVVLGHTIAKCAFSCLETQLYDCFLIYLIAA